MDYVLDSNFVGIELLDGTKVFGNILKINPTSIFVDICKMVDSKGNKTSKVGGVEVDKKHAQRILVSL